MVRHGPSRSEGRRRVWEGRRGRHSGTTAEVVAVVHNAIPPSYSGSSGRGTMQYCRQIAWIRISETPLR
eukprot:1954768-Rhodomonas_salina.4